MLEINDEVYFKQRGWQVFQVVAFCDNPDLVWIAQTHNGLVNNFGRATAFLANISALSRSPKTWAETSQAMPDSNQINLRPKPDYL